MLLKSCGRCGRLIPYGRTYCADCQAQVDQYREEQRQKYSKERNRRYNKKRDPKYSQFYNSKEWRTLARTRLQADGYRCRECGAIAAEVDHIIPIQTPEGWERRLDYDNTQSLCTSCHNAKHDRFKPRVSRNAIAHRKPRNGF